MSMKRIVIMFILIITLIISVSFTIVYLVKPEIRFLVYWITGVAITALVAGSAIAQIIGYSLRDLLITNDLQAVVSDALVAIVNQHGPTKPNGTEQNLSDSHGKSMYANSGSYKYDVFLSHSSKDRSAVEALAERLEDEAGVRVFLDKWNLIPGDPWQEDLEEALEQSQTVAVFLGPSGISGWHNEEMRNALNTRVKDRGRRVVPVLLPGTTMLEEDKIPGFLSRLTWVDFRNGLDDEEAFRRLVAGIKGHPPERK